MEIESPCKLLVNITLTNPTLHISPFTIKGKGCELFQYTLPSISQKGRHTKIFPLPLSLNALRMKADISLHEIVLRGGAYN